MRKAERPARSRSFASFAPLLTDLSVLLELGEGVVELRLPLRVAILELREGVIVAAVLQFQSAAADAAAARGRRGVAARRAEKIAGETCDPLRGAFLRPDREFGRTDISVHERQPRRGVAAAGRALHAPLAVLH